MIVLLSHEGGPRLLEPSLSEGGFCQPRWSDGDERPEFIACTSLEMLSYPAKKDSDPPMPEWERGWLTFAIDLRSRVAAGSS